MLLQLSLFMHAVFLKTEHLPEAWFQVSLIPFSSYFFPFEHFVFQHAMMNINTQYCGFESES